MRILYPKEIISILDFKLILKFSPSKNYLDKFFVTELKNQKLREGFTKIENTN